VNSRLKNLRRAKNGRSTRRINQEDPPSRSTQSVTKPNTIYQIG
jgi:hypothetical protein